MSTKNLRILIMRASVKLFKNDGVSKFGYPIKVILSHNSKEKRKTIGHAYLEDWDLVSDLPLTSHAAFGDLYPEILNIRAKAVERDFLKLERFDLALEYITGIKKRTTTNFYSWCDERIAIMKRKKRFGNADAYLYAKNQFEKFAPDLNFKDVTPELLEQFKQYKLEIGNKNSTVKNYLVELRAMYNAAVKAKIIEDEKPFQHLFNDLRIKRRRADNKYLSKETILKLENLSDVTPAQKRALQLSLLQFYLGGASLVDIYFLEWSQIENNRIFFETRIKLTDRGSAFDVLIPEKAWVIINTYKTDGKYVFPWRKDYVGYETFRSNHNDDLKTMQKKHEIKCLPQDKNLTSKVFRHTFATLGKFARIEEDLLRELMGHERDQIDTIYKDRYPVEERDAAQLEIIRV